MAETSFAMYILQIMRDLNTLRIHIQVGSRTLCDTTWADGGRKDFLDPFSRLYLVRSGRGAVIHSGRLFELRPGHLFCIPAYVSGRYRCPREMDLMWVHYQATIHGCLEPFAYFGWDPVVTIPATLPAVALMEQAISTGPEKDAARALAADGALRQLLSPFVTGKAARPGLARFAPVFGYIESHLGERLTLADLAAQVHLQPNYFSNRFAAITGTPPMQFVNRRRVEAIAARLRFANETLSELAEDFGFTDAFHLSKAFKKTIGLSPSAYRKSAWREDR